MTARSMHNNLVFNGISEKEGENVEDELRRFFTNTLGIKTETARRIAFKRVHRLAARKEPDAESPNPSYALAAAGPVAKASSRGIIACFEDSRYKEMVFRAGPKLKGKDFGISQQYPAEIVARRKELLPTFKEERDKKKGKGKACCGQTLY